MESQGAASEMVTVAGAFKAHLEAMGVGTALFVVGEENDPDRWAVAVVMGAENVRDLEEWRAKGEAE